MTQLYLVNFATTADWEAHRDDGGFDCTEDMAQPVGVVTEDIQKALDQFKQEYEEMVVADELPLPVNLKWGETVSQPDHFQYELVHNGEPVGVAIARKVGVL